MPKLQYWMMGNGLQATRVEEREFAELPARAGEFDLFLWVDGAVAVAGKRGLGGTERASTKLFPARRDDDGELRAASARAMLALIRSRQWMTPTEAVQAGNTLGAKPTEKNAFLTVAKGRHALDVEIGHERWRAFGLRRKSNAEPEGSLRFEPGEDLAWLVAWSEVSSQESAEIGANLPLCQLKRIPLTCFIYGLRIIIRDALINIDLDELVLLFEISDPNLLGPILIERVDLITGGDKDNPSLVIFDSYQPGPRIRVPGETVERLRTLRTELPRDVFKPWVCMAWHGVRAFGIIRGATRVIPVRWTVLVSGQRIQRTEDVEFRVLGR